MTESQNENAEPEQGRLPGDNAEQVGRRLKKAREKADIHINDMAARLRLTTSQLKAIEAGRLEQFSAAIYVKGYVANYARQVGLKPDAVVRDLHLAEERQPLTPATGVTPARRLAENVARWATYAVGTIVVILPIVWWASEGSMQLLFGDRAPEAAQQDTGVSAGEGAAVAPARDDQPMLASMAPVRTQRPAGPPTPEQTGAGSSGQDQAAGQEKDAGAAPKAPELVLNVKQDSWVEIRDAAGERLEYDLLRAGTTHSYSGNAPYHVLLGNAGAVEVRYNDAPFDLTPFVQGNLARFEVGDAPDNG